MFIVIIPVPLFTTVPIVVLIMVIVVSTFVLYVRVPEICTFERLAGVACDTFPTIDRFEIVPLAVPFTCSVLNFVPVVKNSIPTIFIEVTRFVPPAFTGCVAIVGHSSCACTFLVFHAFIASYKSSRVLFAVTVIVFVPLFTEKDEASFATAFVSERVTFVSVNIFVSPFWSAIALLVTDIEDIK